MSESDSERHKTNESDCAPVEGEDSIRTGETDGVLEENSGVVDDGVATSELLEDLRGRTDGHSPEVLLLATDEELLHRDSGGGTGRGVDALDDDSDLSLRVLVLEVLVVKVGNDLRSGLVVTVDEEPSRRPADQRSR